MVRLGSLHRAEGVSKAWIDKGGFAVQIAGRMFPVEVPLQPFLDPQGNIMRG